MPWVNHICLYILWSQTSIFMGLHHAFLNHELHCCPPLGYLWCILYCHGAMTILRQSNGQVVLASDYIMKMILPGDPVDSPYIWIYDSIRNLFKTITWTCRVSKFSTHPSWPAHHTGSLGSAFCFSISLVRRFPTFLPCEKRQWSHGGVGGRWIRLPWG